jgi:hypothetical protein
LRIVVKVLQQPYGEYVLRIRRTPGQKPSSEELSCFLLFPIDRPLDARTVANINIVNTVKGNEVHTEARVGQSVVTSLSVVTQRDSVWSVWYTAQRVALKVSSGVIVDFGPVSDEIFVKLQVAMLAAWLVLVAVPTASVCLPPPTLTVLMNSLISVALEEDAFEF